MKISEAIQQQYSALKISINQAFGDRLGQLFPDLETINLQDLIYFICYTFSGSNYTDAIGNLCFYYRVNLTADEIEQVAAIVAPHIEFIKSLK